MNIFYLGNPYFVPAMRAAGHHVILANFTPDADILLDRPVLWKTLAEQLRGQDFSPNLVFYADNGNLPFLLDPENATCPSMYYSIDTYCNPWHVPYAYAFDHVWVAQKDFMDIFAKNGVESHWLPLFCNESLSIAEEGQRNIPVSFVGTLGHKNNPGREPFLKRFNAILPLRMSSGDFLPIFSKSQIILNQTAFGEINFRCFEAMALGGALLMEKCANGFEEIFTPGINILPPFSRNDAVEAARIAKIFLDHPQKLAKIAKRGRELVLARHTATARSETILNQAEMLLQNKAAEIRLKDVHRFGIFSKTALAMLGSELSNGSMKEYGNFFLSASRQD